VDEIDAVLRAAEAASERPNASVEDLLAGADALWRGFHFSKAVRAFQIAAERAPTSPLPCLCAAKRLFTIGRFAEALEFLTTALSRAPRSVSIRRMLAEVLESNGDFSTAEGVIREALDESPGDARAVRAFAHLLRRTGRVDEAVEVLRNHLCSYPADETWRINHELAGCLDLQGNYAEALTALSKAKAALQPVAKPLLQQWSARAVRRTEFARCLDTRTLQRWREATSEFSETHRITILAGHPRSGTTLLEQMLGRHSQVITTDETGILRRQFLEAVVLAAPSTRAAFTEVDGFDKLQLEAGRAFYMRATKEHMGEPIGRRMLVEKDPLATWDLGFILRLLPESQIILPLRDPRDVCVSFFFTILPFNADSAPAIDFESTCAAMHLTLCLWKHWKSILPQSWREVRYEQLVQDARGELMQLSGFLSLGFEESMASPARRPAQRGVVAPSYADVTQPLSARSIGRWRNYASWLEPHFALLTPWLREFGYG
jgi:tetratricopeptide (TPR) repeat protein